MRLFNPNDIDGMVISSGLCFLTEKDNVIFHPSVMESVER